jgi:hypothetical protein
LHDELRDTYIPPNIVKVMKIEDDEKGGSCDASEGVEKCVGGGGWWENLKGKRPIGRPGVDGRLTLNKCERNGTMGRELN